MTNQEAIKIIKTEKECVKRTVSDQCDRDCICCDLLLPDVNIQEGYDMAIAALEKQIPKKPAKNGNQHYCENCRMVLATGNRANSLNYCHHCGQAIDWGNAE